MRSCLTSILGTGLCVLAITSTATAAAPGNLAALTDQGRVLGATLTAGGDRPFPEAARLRALTGLGISPNAYRCPPRLGGTTFFRMPAGLGLALLSRGPRHVSVVSLGRDGSILSATRLPCRASARR
ncbi:hypothetical protein [Miltoncostaea oceani]|uniref:hypothetical protein n=1 Tax=Miltoncostaea oceani TaxID=2843216 RepID=UPI001C3C5F66|nr:hypothetical protein [Miltoncostaea oceani]